jgi:hypothetical protein
VSLPLPPPKPETKADKVAAALDKVAAPDWRDAHKFWSIQLSVLWAILCGFYAVLPALQSWFSPFHMVLLSMGCALLIVAARLANQPSLPVV